MQGPMSRFGVYMCWEMSSLLGHVALSCEVHVRWDW